MMNFDSYLHIHNSSITFSWLRLLLLLFLLLRQLVHGREEGGVTGSHLHEMPAGSLVLLASLHVGRRLGDSIRTVGIRAL